MKGLILIAGKGTRLRPLTYSQPKTLLPVAGRSVFTYAIESLYTLGIQEIGVVLNPSQENAVRKHLKKIEFNVTFTIIHQKDPQGIADAVFQAKTFIGQDPFLLLLGDNLIQESLAGLKQQIIQHKGNGAIMLARVSNPGDYGIAEVHGDKIVGLEEKPASPKSNLAVIGAYAFDHNLMKAVTSISPSDRGEYEITDAIQWLIDEGYSISYSITDQHYSDVGTTGRWLEANRWKMDELTQSRNIISSEVKLDECTIIPPVLIEKGCTLNRSTIGPYVYVARGACIDHCHIENSILLTGAQLREIPYKVQNSIFGRKVQVCGTGKQGFSNQFILGDNSSIVIQRTMP